ncbi:MAG TPA: LysR family transcriptional regulator [Gammaproteobacteria bacterium]|nr:LysR family transcriptional regulator [Gammaproteobacteria bacterium]
MFIELRHLRTLQALSETGSLAAAARRLHLTQSALSHQLRALEHHFETPMVRKGTRPLALTPAGERLLALARRVLPEVEQAERELGDPGRVAAARLYLTLECHACYDWLLPLLARFRETWPAVDIDIRQARFEALPDLLSGEVDLVVTSDRSRHRSLHFSPLFAYEARAVLAESHPLARLRRIQPHHLAGETLITYPVPAARLDVFTRFLDPAGVSPAAVRQSELTAVILQLVASRRGVAVLPDWVLHASLCPPGLVSRPLGRRGLRGTMYAALRGADAELPWVRDFVALASR